MSEIELRAQQTDQLGFREVVTLFLRTYPFVRPVFRHLGQWVGFSGLLFVWTAFWGFISVTMIYGNVISGDPVSGFAAWIFGLDRSVFVDVEALSVEARMALRWDVLWFALILYGPLVTGGILLAYYRIWIFQQINQNMRAKLNQQLQILSLKFHSDTRIGDSIYRVYQDSSMVTQIIQSILIEPVMFIGRYLFSVVFVALFNPWFALVMGVSFLPLLFLANKFTVPMRRGFRLAREANSRLTSWIQETVASIRIVKACGAESARYAGFEDQSREAFNESFRARDRLAIFGVLAFMAVATTLLILEMGFALLASVDAAVFARDILLLFGFTVWNLASFSTTRGRASDGVVSLENLLTVWGRAQDMAVGLDRVYTILDIVPDVTDREDAHTLSEFKDSVTFEQVHFAYGEKPILRELDFSASRGTVTAIVGPTGSGKSTMMSLLLRLIDPDSGTVRIDGVDIRDITVESLRNNISIATQENVLFSTTVAENISYAAPGASLDDVREAAKVADADGFIEGLFQGYETPLGERAIKLSTGQRQRLVIARAVIKNTPILILDEPTAALDAETEHRVLSNLKAWGEQRCIFLITHRLSTVAQADQVLYLRDGQIVETGSHQALMARDGAYRSFVLTETGFSDT